MKVHAGDRLTALEERAARLPATARLGTAAALAALALATAMWLDALGAPAVFSPLLLAIAVAVWLLGTGPAVLLAVLGGLGAPYLVLGPRLSFGVADGGDAVGLAAYVVTGAGIVALGGALRAARRRAEAASRRSALLARAGLALEGSASVDARLEELARIAVPDLADWCAIDLPGPGGAPELRAIAHGDPERLRLARELRRRYPPDPRAPTGFAQVMRTGRPEFHPEVTDAMLVAAAVDDEHLAMLRRIGFTSAILVPLTARGRVRGVLTLVTSQPDRRLTEDDLHLAEELAGRAAVALDLAQLYEDEVAAADRLSRLQSVTAAVSAAITHQGVAEAVIREGMPALGAEAAVVTVVRGDQLHVVASAGYSPEVLEGRTTMSLSLPLPGAEAVRRRRLVAVSTGEELLARYPALQGAPREFEALAAAPLIYDGEAIGFLGFSFANPREFERGDRDFLVTLAQVAASALVRAGLYDAEHTIAQTLQRSLLPAHLPRVPGLDVGVRYLPLGEGNQVGGDFYDLFTVGDALAVVIGDVCGKGVEAAALTALARHTLRALAEPGRPPSELLMRLNDAIIRQRGRQTLFLTGLVAMLRPTGDGFDLSVCCAGHPPGLHVRAGGAVEVVGTRGTLLGPFADVRLTDAHGRLEAGESLVLYTDGVSEARRRGVLFGEERLRELLAERGGGRDAASTARAVEEAAVRHQGGPLRDDLAVVVLRALEPGAGTGTGVVAVVGAEER